MDRKIIVGLIMGAICLLAHASIFPCTGFFAVAGQRVLFGHNEDYHWTDSSVRVRPPANGNHGYLYVGFNRLDAAFGGMNDQGLVLDSFANPECNWQEDLNKEYFSGDWFQHLLRTCTTVEEVIYFCHQYNLPYFRHNHLFAADQWGKSVVIEWGEGKIEVIRKQGDFQVVTNFFLLHPEWGWHPCWRYDTATEMLNESTEISRELFRSILDAVHVSTTQYSNIYEVLQGNMYFFNHHNFDEYLKFNLNDELAKGWNNYLISNFMSSIRLGEPEDGQLVDPSRVEFSWQGKPDSQYQFHYSINPDFANCAEIEIVNDLSAAGRGIPVVFMLLWILPFGLRLNFRDKLKIGMFLLLPVVLLMPACNTFDGEDHGLIHEFTAELENLQPGSTYYWKVTASATDSMTSQSITRSFTTMATGTGSEE